MTTPESSEAMAPSTGSITGSITGSNTGSNTGSIIGSNTQKSVFDSTKAPLQLPPRMPKQNYRPAQSNIPDDKLSRLQIGELAVRFLEKEGIVPPISLAELREYAVRMLADAGLNLAYANYAAVLLNNASWRDTLAAIPFERRLLLVPKCLRIEEHCPAPFDEFGLLCKECGLCSIQDLTVEAERLGYAVLVAEGSAIVRAMIETGRVEGIVGVSCLNVLEKCFPHMEAGAVPGVAIPLLQDDCINTTVDMEWVWDAIHLTSNDRTYRLDLDTLKTDVKSWFSEESLDRLMGSVTDDTERIAREWMLRDGKRWRPYLSACVHMAHASHESETTPEITDDLKKLCVAVECFHKASLIHDDIEDEDKERYGEPSTHAQYGIPVALNVGDFLLGEGYRLIGELDIDPSAKASMLQAAASGHVSLCRGQGAELLWARDPKPLTSLEVLDIFRQKTAPAFEIALRLGAYFTGTDEPTHSVLKEYSESLGIAYQIRDDLDDATGESDSDDVDALRPSILMSIAHKRATGDDMAFVEACWRRKASPQEAKDSLRRIYQEQGILAKADELLDAYEAQAVRSLSTLTNATLKGLLRRVIGKIFGDRLIEGYCSEFEARNASGRETGAATS